METAYKLDDRDMGINVCESIAFDVADSSGETEYLLQSPANRAMLEKAIANTEAGRNIVSFETIEQAIQSAQEQAMR